MLLTLTELSAEIELPVQPLNVCLDIVDTSRDWLWECEDRTVAPQAFRDLLHRF